MNITSRTANKPLKVNNLQQIIITYSSQINRGPDLQQAGQYGQLMPVLDEAHNVCSMAVRDPAETKIFAATSSKAWPRYIRNRSQVHFVLVSAYQRPLLVKSVDISTVEFMHWIYRIRKTLEAH